MVVRGVVSFMHIYLQSLSDELENIRSENKDMQERLILSSPPMSPIHPSLSPHSPRPLSPTSSLGDGSPLSSSAGSSILLEQLDQLQFDKEESEVKYDEMKVSSGSLFTV